MLKSHGTKLYLLLLIHFTVTFIAVFFFAKGFLLTRFTLSDVSSDTPPSVEGSHSLDNSTGWYPPQYKRIVFILIDALRFDFAAPAIKDSTFLNKLSIIEESLREKNENTRHSMLFYYVADPPTTTLQRLKALTTGTLPTFIESASNFGGGGMVTEDSWVLQLKRANYTSVFLGDDTWMSLFPTQFTFYYPFPSFNVWDLHLVDNGVLENIYEYLDTTDPQKSNKNSFIVAHFLGVDHCGHWYGPEHPAMAQKLNQMNSVLKKVIEKIKNDPDSLLLVMGDHGMDEKGDHGGDSVAEVGSALFAYSAKGFKVSQQLDLALSRLNLDYGWWLSIRNADSEVQNAIKAFTELSNINLAQKKWRTIPQIDIVPTISLLLGLPIPFSNLGAIIPEFFANPSSNDTFSMILNAARISANQVNNYIHQYLKEQNAGAMTEQLSKETAYEWGRLLAKAELLNKENSQVDAYVYYMRFLRVVLSGFRRIWARFDLWYIVCGVSMLCVWLGVSLVFHSSFSRPEIVIGFGLIFLALGGFLQQFCESALHFLFEDKLNEFIDVTFVALVAGFIIGLSIVSSSSPVYGIAGNLLQDWNTLDIMASLVFIIHMSVFMSNSFIVYEDGVVAGLVITQHLSMFYVILTLQPESSEKRAIVSSLKTRFMIAMLIQCLLTRISGHSTVCRQEQAPFCVPTFYSSIGSTSASNLQLICFVSIPVIIPWLLEKYLTSTNSLYGIAKLWVQIGMRLALGLAAVYWVMEENSVIHDSSQETLEVENARAMADFAEKGWLWHWSKLIMARIVLGITLFVAPYSWWNNPLCFDLQIHTLEKDKNNETVPRKDNPGQNHLMIILGYDNIYGAAYLVAVLTLYVLLSLVQQPTGALILAVGLVHILCYLEANQISREIHELCIPQKDEESKSAPKIKWHNVVTWCVLTQHYFFRTGHQATFSSVQWRPAFIGFDHMNYILSPILVIMNHCGSYILFTAASPLLAFWKLKPQISDSEAMRNRSQKLWKSLEYIITGILFYWTILLAQNMFFSSWFRRHLMLWEVWAPRLIQSVMTVFIIFTVFLIFTLLCVIKVINEVNQAFRSK